MRKRKFVFGSSSACSRLTEVSDPDQPKPTSSIFVPFNFRPSTPPPPPPPPPGPPPPLLESATPVTPSLASTPAPSDPETTEAYGQSNTSEDTSSVSESEPSPKRHRPQRRTPCALRVGFEDQDHVLCLPEAVAESDVEFLLEVCPKVAQQITHVRVISGPGSCLCPRHMFSQSAIDVSAVLALLPKVMSVTTVQPERPLSPQEERTYDLSFSSISRLIM